MGQKDVSVSLKMAKQPLRFDNEVENQARVKYNTADVSWRLPHQALPKIAQRKFL